MYEAKILPSVRSEDRDADSTDEQLARCLSRIAMACFVEGINPSSLGLSPRHLIAAEKIVGDLSAESHTVSYCRCLEALSEVVDEADEDL